MLLLLVKKRNHITNILIGMNTCCLDKNLNSDQKLEKYCFGLAQISTEDSATALDNLSGLFTNPCATTQITKEKKTEVT